MFTNTYGNFEQAREGMKQAVYGVMDIEEVTEEE